MNAFAIGVDEGMEKLALKPETVASAMAARLLRTTKTLGKGKDLSKITKARAVRAVEKSMEKKRPSGRTLGDIYEAGMNRATKHYGDPSGKQLRHLLHKVESREMKGYKMPQWMIDMSQEGKRSARTAGAAEGARRAAKKNDFGRAKADRIRAAAGKKKGGGGGGEEEAKGMSTGAKVGIGAGIAGAAGGGAYLAHRATRRRD